MKTNKEINELEIKLRQLENKFDYSSGIHSYALLKEIKALEKIIRNCEDEIEDTYHKKFYEMNYTPLIDCIRYEIYDNGYNCRVYAGKEIEEEQDKRSKLGYGWFDYIQIPKKFAKLYGLSMNENNYSHVESIVNNSGNWNKYFEII